MVMSSAIVTGIMEALAGAQSEIAIFIAAIFVHALIFGKFRIPQVQVKKRVSPDDIRPKAKQCAATSADTVSLACSRRGAALARALEPMLLCNHTAASWTTKFSELLKDCPVDDFAGTLTSVLKTMGKKATAEILEAARAILKAKDVQLCAQSGATLLQGYLSLGLQREFAEVLAVVTEAEGMVPSIALLALRGAVAWSDLEGALQHMRVLAPAFSSNETPSMAPHTMLQKLVKLAAGHGATIRLLQGLLGCGCLTSAAFEMTIIESVQARNSHLRQEILELARAEKVQLNSTAYCSLVHSVHTAEEAECVFNEAVELKLVNPALLAACAEVAGKFGNAKLANLVVENVQSNPSPEVVLAVLSMDANKLLSDKKISVIDLYESYLSDVDISANMKAMHAVAEAAISARRLDILRRVMGATAESGRQVALLKAFSMERRLQDAVKVFQACPEKAQCHFNALLDACTDSRDLEAAESVMAQAVESDMADVVTYNTILKARLQAGAVQRARRTLDQMRKAGVQPNNVSFHELLNSVVTSNPEKIWPIMSEMSESGLHPNNTTCSILLKSITKQSSAADVKRTLATLDNLSTEMDEVLLSSVCEACVRAGQAELLVKQLRKQRTSRTVDIKGPHTYGSLIRAYGSVNDMQGVWDMWREMRQRHIVPTSITLGCMVEAVVANGDPDGGYEIICEVLQDKQTTSFVNAVIYCSVLKGFSHKKRFDKVWTVYREMREAKIQFSIVTYNTLVDACARNNEMNHVPELLSEMAEQGINPNVITYSSIIKGYCQEFKLDKAFELLEGMKGTNGFKPDEITYNTLLDGCARQGLYDRGMQVLQSMEEEGVPATNFTLSVLVKLANRSHKLQAAFTVCRDLSKKYGIKLNTQVYNNLMQACIAHQELNTAFDVFQQMLSERVYTDARSYTLLLRAAVSDRRAQEAIDLIRLAVGLPCGASRLSQVDGRVAKLRGGLPAEIIAEVLEGIANQCKEQKLAVQMLREMQQVPGLKVDPRLCQRLTARAIRSDS